MSGGRPWTRGPAAAGFLLACSSGSGWSVFRTDALCCAAAPRPSAAPTPPASMTAVRALWCT